MGLRWPPNAILWEQLLSSNGGTQSDTDVQASDRWLA
jgi:hypothetical protein